MGAFSTGKGQGREWGVLAGGLASSLALVGTAFSSRVDPGVAGEAAMAQLASDVAGGVRGEWERLRRDRAFVGVGSASGIQWARGFDPSGIRPEPRTLTRASGPEYAAFDALFAESERLELGPGDSREALKAMGEALTHPCDSARRAEARLRSIVLAARCGDVGVVAEQWSKARAELDGLDSRGDTSYLLLCGLAAAPELSASDRLEAYDQLVHLWLNGGLSVPAPTNHSGAELVGRVRALLDELERLGGEASSPDARLDDIRSRLRSSLVAENIGGLPEFPDSDVAQALFEGQSAFVFAAIDAEVAAGRVFTMPQLRATVHRALEENQVVPAGFSVDFDGGDQGAGEVVRPRTALWGDRLGFVLRHSDPASIVQSELERVRLVRGGLLAMALLTAGAAAAIARAMRRERRLNELRSSFIANVSHELRTPLASILLLAENLESGRVSEREACARYHTSIRKEATRLQRLVEEVLDFSRLERGHGPEVRREDVAVAPFAESLGEELTARAREAGATLRYCAKNAPSSACIDAEALRRALLNLTENALRHSGSDKLDVEWSAESDGALLVSVRDYGRGIPARQRAEAFEPFAQLRADGNGSQGAGLGLAIVREIVEAHGGSVSAHDPGSGPGVVFQLRIPIPMEGSS